VTRNRQPAAFFIAVPKTTAPSINGMTHHQQLAGYSYLLCGNCTSCPMLFECWLSAADFSSYTICIEMDDFAVYSFQYSEIPVCKML
jgi:hypothetical protein